MSTQPKPGVKTMRLAIEIEVLVDSPDEELDWVREQLAGQTGNLAIAGYGFHVTKVEPEATIADLMFDAEGARRIIEHLRHTPGPWGWEIDCLRDLASKIPDGKYPEDDED